jgi:RNA polymerase sigma-70 factor (ECF subfamily)
MTVSDAENQHPSGGEAFEAREGAGPRTGTPDFRELFEAECSYVWTTLKRFGVPDRDLEDVAHDVFMVVHRQLGQYDTSRPLRPWLCGIAFRVASDYRRLARNRRERLDAAEGEIETEDPGPSADERLTTEQSHALALKALETVEIDQRVVFVMHDVDGATMPEIARSLGIPLNTAYSRLRLARERLQTAARRIQRRQGEP